VHRGIFSFKRLANVYPVVAALDQSDRDYDLLMLGAGPNRLGDASVTGRVLSAANVPAIVVRSADGVPPPRFTRLLVPLDGRAVSRAAAELALLYARAVNAEVTIVSMLNESRVTTGSLVLPESREAHDVDENARAAIEAHIRRELDDLSDGQQTGIDVRVLASGDPASTIIELANTGAFDLLVLGAEARTLVHSSLFGLGTAEILDRAHCTVAVAVPQLSS
jgi:nucleotide-binding universal stress UspA family protein